MLREWFDDVENEVSKVSRLVKEMDWMMGREIGGSDRDEVVGKLEADGGRIGWRLKM